MKFDEGFIQDLRARNDIVDVVSGYVQLRGRGRYTMGLCPFHNEKTPSFCVYSDTQSYYCFGCGKSGDVITFIRDIENLDYTDAVKFLANRAGMTVPLGDYDDSYAKLSRRILAANREAGKFWYNYMNSPDGSAGLDYFTARGLSPATMRHFGLGFAPDKWDLLVRHLRKLGYTDSEMLTADLARKTKNGSLIDAFRNRVMFPIINVQGQVIAFGGRVLDDSKPKYRNTSDTPVYKKSNGVFALNFAKNTAGKTLILCEGYMDVIAYHQAGFTNAVAGLGTAFTQEQAKLLSRYADEIILSYDGDEAGQKATKRAISILSNTNLKVRVAVLQGGKDPDEIIKRHGKEKMRTILDSAVSATDFELGRARTDIDLTSDDGKADYLAKSVEIISSLTSAIKRDIAVTKVANETGVSKSAIEAEVERAIKKSRVKRSNEEFKRAASFSDTAASQPTRLTNSLEGVKAQEALLGNLIKEPNLYKKCRDSLSKELFSDDKNKKIYSCLAQRLDENDTLDISLLYAELEDTEKSRLGRIIASREGLSSSLEEISDCISKMKDAKKKLDAEKINFKEISDEDWGKLFK